MLLTTAGMPPFHNLLLQSFPLLLHHLVLQWFQVLLLPLILHPVQVTQILSTLVQNQKVHFPCSSGELFQKLLLPSLIHLTTATVLWMWLITSTLWLPCLWKSLSELKILSLSKTLTSCTLTTSRVDNINNPGSWSQRVTVNPRSVGDYKTCMPQFTIQYDWCSAGVTDWSECQNWKYQGSYDYITGCDNLDQSHSDSLKKMLLTTVGMLMYHHHLQQLSPSSAAPSSSSVPAAPQSSSAPAVPSALLPQILQLTQTPSTLVQTKSSPFHAQVVNFPQATITVTDPSDNGDGTWDVTINFNAVVTMSLKSLSELKILSLSKTYFVLYNPVDNINNSRLLVSESDCHPKICW